LTEPGTNQLTPGKRIEIRDKLHCDRDPTIQDEGRHRVRGIVSPVHYPVNSQFGESAGVFWWKPQMTKHSIRPATDGDSGAIGAVHRAAFETDLEARLVALLSERGISAISLVAEVDGQIPGHILFSPATLERGPTGHAPLNGLGLAPVAVLPAFQNQGLGSALVRAGLAECRRLATVGPAGPAGPELPVDPALANPGPARQSGPTPVSWVVVLGHETYYPRFGFAPASRWNLTGDYGDSDAFQFLPLTAATDAIRGGHIRYAPEFGEVCGSTS
jgi:putative acetyltransferase